MSRTTTTPTVPTRSPESYTTRAEPETLRARSLSVSLTVDDLERSLRWYRDTVGFAVGKQWEHEGEVHGVELRAGNVTLMLNQDDGARGRNRIKGQGMALYLDTGQDLDERAARIKRAGGSLESEPADMPWGSRMFRVRDPDGFLLVIASSR